VRRSLRGGRLSDHLESRYRIQYRPQLPESHVLRLSDTGLRKRFARNRIKGGLDERRCSAVELFEQLGTVDDRQSAWRADRLFDAALAAFGVLDA